MDPSNSMQWNVGVELGSFRDDLIVPLGFHGPGVILGAEYRRTNGKWQFDLPFTYKFNFLLNRFDHTGMAFSVDLKPSLMHSIPLDDDLGQIKAGLALPFKLNNFFPFSWDDAHLYWFTIRGAALALEWQTHLRSKKVINIHLELPIISQIARPPTYRYEKQDPGLAWVGFKSTPAKRQYETASWGDYQSIAVRGEFESTPVSSWIMEFEYDHYDHPADVWGMSTTLRYARKFRSW